MCIWLSDSLVTVLLSATKICGGPAEETVGHFNITPAAQLVTDDWTPRSRLWQDQEVMWVELGKQDRVYWSTPHFPSHSLSAQEVLTLLGAGGRSRVSMIPVRTQGRYSHTWSAWWWTIDNYIESTLFWFRDKGKALNFSLMSEFSLQQLLRIAVNSINQTFLMTI